MMRFRGVVLVVIAVPFWVRGFILMSHFMDSAMEAESSSAFQTLPKALVHANDIAAGLTLAGFIFLVLDYSNWIHQGTHGRSS